MAEDREAFRDLLDRIGQPYAPSCDRRGRDRRRRATRRRDAALAEIGLPAIVRPAFTLGGTGGGIVETEAAYRERIRAGLRASPIGQVMVERCLVGWQEIEYEVMRDADDTCIAVCSMENVDPLGVHTGDSIVVAPVQTLTDAVHQLLRSAALAIIRALGVEGGCNVQFALVPDSTDYAVIEVNPRVSPLVGAGVEGDRLPDRPGRGPDRGRPAAGRDPERRHRARPSRPSSRRSTTSSSSCRASRSTSSRRADRTPRHADEGDRRGDGDRPDVRAALNKALRGLEQAGRRAARRGPGLDADASTTSPAVYARRPDDDGRGDEPIRWVDERGPGLRIDPPRPADAPRRSSCAGSSRRPTSRLWRILGLLRRGVPEAVDPARRPGSRRGSSPRWAATSRSKREVARGRRAARRPDRRGGGARCSRRSSGPASATASWPTLAGVDGRTRSGRPGWRSACVPGYAMVDTCAAEFAAETPYFYSTYAAAGSRAGGAAGRAARRRSSSASGPVRIGQGIEFDYCAVQAADTLRARGLAGGDDQLEPGDGLDRLRRLVAALLRAARPGERPQRDRGRDARPASTLLPAVVAFGGQTPLNLAAPLAAGGRAAARQRPRGDRPGRGADAVLGAPRPARHPAARGRDGPQRRGGADPRRADRLPGHRPAVFVIGGLAIDFCYSPEDLVRQLAAATVVDPDRPVRIDRYLEGIEVDVDAVCDGERVLIPGLLEHVERAGVHSRRLGRHVPAADASARATRTLIVATMERIVLALGVRGLVNAQFIVREDGVYLIEVNPRAVADRAVPVEGHRRADGRAGRPDRARRDARRARLAERPARSRRRSSRSRRRPSRRPSCAASTRRSGRGCSRPAR